ncbi:SusC/RagA family TonB-linked outer membrane protein [Chitinophaga oryzae]|uniref:SusC/RagA family TonB-linked outer membrane protein n=1 Tax=Chitinophaga oryzae TaxID=2725414 RepID=A0AAE7D7E9_9BACT|nr:SusC/RagA family TonB-linked outer membrane protein [Chitinophaga oryzae]QJB30961.1 SusC/RagA family TonB-linked outer membrane protein [Chitinophaga oryzae]QJB37446.1 SusC/RagA family TonB-linked outer membrane protein [Chitinophaga oryzae]
MMKLTGMLMLAFCLQVSARVYSQKVTLTGRNASVQQLFSTIRQQTGYLFLYSNETLKNTRAVSAQLTDVPLKEALDYITSNQPITYSIEENNTILIKPKPVADIPAPVLQRINGTVRDARGMPLIGVTVKIKGTNGGTITDEQGAWYIQAADEATVLVFSFIGYKNHEEPIKGRTVIHVVLSQEDKSMNEVVVTGYQKVERRSLTSSITSLKTENLKTINQPNIDKLLQGQVPGMVVMSTSGAPGAVPQIRIRGTSTLSGNTQPLWVVDGIILDDPINASVDDIMTNRNLIASGIGGINVEDIESINVLKDAAATAIYGTKAANGVIVLTSKKGTAGKTRINFSSFATVGMRPRIEDAYMMNSKERIGVNLEMMRRGVLTAGSSRAGEYGTSTDFERALVDVHDHKITWADFEKKVNQLESVNTDWFDYLFRNSFTHRQNLNISGGNEKTTFYLSGSYMDEQATALQTGMKTYTGSLKVYTKLHPTLRVGGMLDLNRRDNSSFFATDSRENPFEWSIYTTRAQNAYDENGQFNHLYYTGIKYNFLENRNYGWRNSQNFGIRGTLDLEWKPINSLIFSSLFSFANQNTTDEDVATENSYFVKSRQRDYYIVIDYQGVQLWKEGGYRKGRNNNNKSLTLRNQVSFMPVLNAHHRFDVMAGQEIRTSRYEDEVTEIYGYVHERGRQQMPQFELMKQIGRPYWSESLNQTAAVSYFGTTGYTYKNRYTVSFNARTDGSNRFGLRTNQLFQPLWAVGANYQMKEENFFANKDWLSYLTLRASYGSQGNVASQAYSDLVATIGKPDLANTDNYLIINAPKNPNLKWEKNYTTNLALEIGLWKRRVMATVEWYHKKGVDLLGSKRVSQVSGFNTLQVNWASMKNTGLEVSISTINIDRKDFRWSTNINAGYNRNEVLDVYSLPTVDGMTNAQRYDYAASAVVGKPINGLWSYRFAGLNKDGRATFYTAKPGETVSSGMRNINGLEYSGSTMPLVQGGFTNTISYKKFTLSALFIGSFGNVIRLRNLTSSDLFYYPEPTQNLSAEWVNRWQQPGDELTTNIPRLESETNIPGLTDVSPYNGTMYNNSDLRTVKGDFVRLQNLSLSYDLYNAHLRKSGIQNMRFMLQGNNLHVWKNSALKGQDPEATGSVMKYDNTRSANVSFGNTYLPLPRSYSFSFSLQF